MLKMACLTTHRLAVLAVLCVACVTAFNVDLDTFVRHRGTPRSMFGFTVAQYKHRNQNWMLVGAPEAQTSQPGVSKGGAVFRCDLSRDDACQEISFDRSGNNNNSAGLQIDRKTEQWFGATLQTSAANGVIVACAPRYVSFNSRVERRDPVGTCWVSRNGFTDMAEYSPCRTRNWGHHRQGSCQAGLGAAVSENGERLFVGAVGSWYWQGQLFDIATDARFPFYPPSYQDFGAGQLYAQSLTDRPSVMSTKEGPAADDDSYLGYSVTAGDFDASGRPGVAVGMPRGAGLVGKIVLYTWDLSNFQNITGDQIGGYFGYSLCSSDVDGDGLADLVIGAPLYTDPKNNKHYENGRVYIVYQGVTDKFSILHTRDGANSKARFGLSVATLGDINRDGYGDFVVGAPYDGDEGRGAVYIFHGSKAGCQEKYSQVIYAENVGPNLSTFGFSVSGGHDLDNNEYPDLAVGAYESETAFFLKSRPVVRMAATLQFDSASKLISLKERNCTTRDGTSVPCIMLTACFTFSGTGVGRELDLSIQFLLDTKKTNNKRMFLLDNEGRSTKNFTERLYHNSRFCKKQTVYITDKIRDKLTPLEAEVRYGLVGSGAYSQVVARAQRSITPILDQAGAVSQKDSVNIEKNCGKDNVCIPDLKLVVNPSVDQYLLGSGDRFTLDVVVENFGEDSFESTYNLRLPEGMSYNKIERVDDFEREIPVQCSAPALHNNFTLKCDIGNPLPRRKLVHFKVHLTPFHRAGMKSRYDFAMEVNSTNPEAKGATADNLVQLSVPIWVQTDHIVSGYSYPSAEIAYNASAYRSANLTVESDVGPQVVHVYSVKNQGPSDIIEAEAFFVWPATTLDDEQLLYLLEQPQTVGNIKCEPAPSVNPLGLALESAGKKTALEYHGLAPPGGSASSKGFAGKKQGGQITEEERMKETFRSGSSSSSSSSSGSTYHYSSSSSSASNSTAEREAREQILKSGGRIYGVGVRSRIEEGSSVHVEPGSFRGGVGQRGQGLAGLEKDYRTFDSQGGRAGSQSSRTYESGTTNTRGQTGDNVDYSGGRQNGRVSGTRTQTSSSETRTGSSSNVDTSGSRTAQGGRGSEGRQNGRVHGSAEVGGRQNGRVGGETRTYSSNSETSHSSGESRGTAGGDYAVGGIRTHQSGGSSHHEGRGQDGDFAIGGGGQRTYHESRNYTSTFSENGGAPRTYSNYSFANSTGAGNVSGGWHSGDPHGLGVVGAGHTSHESRSRDYAGSTHSAGSSSHGQGSYGQGSYSQGSGSYGQGSGSISQGSSHGSSSARDYGSTARQSNLEQSSRSGYNVGNPRSEERHGWDAERAGSGLAIYNWTNPIDAFGAGSSSRPRNQEPGFGDSSEVRQRGRNRAEEERIRAEEERIRQEEERTRYEQERARYEAEEAVRQREHERRRAWEERERRRQEADERQRAAHRSGTHTETRTSSSSSSSSSTSGTKSSRERTGDISSENVDNRFQLYGRFERSVRDMIDLGNGLDSAESISNSKRSRQTAERWEKAQSDQDGGDGEASAARQASDLEVSRAIDCAATKCVTFKCVVGPLVKDEEAFVGLRFRAFARTLNKVAWNRPVQLSSLVAARVTKLPHVGEPFEMKLKTSEIKFDVLPAEVSARPDIVPLWVVVVSACAGMIILLLLIFALYKCGFFKRTRPSDSSAEKQPLNRNGHYNSGDEAL